ncbi:MAG: transposase, partial [Butyrivibrio sp.]|nr:transposase [Butyrivibrio sp.]
MYRTRQYRISKNHILYDYCKDICRSSAVLYNRANFILRQYSSSVDSMAGFKPLFPNQMLAYRLVRDNLTGTKYLGASKWLTYNALDHLLKITRDKAYYALPSQANQQILKLLLRDYKSFFEAVKVYGRNPEAFTGRPKMPGYMSQGSFKTAVLTNQICRIKDGYLRFPGTKDKLSLGQLPEEVCLKEVRIKPCRNSFVLDVVLSVPDMGIIPIADKDILADLSDVVDLKDLRVMAIDPGTDNIAAVANTFGVRPFVIKGGVIKSINQLYNKEMKRLSSCAMTCNNRYRTRKMNALTEKRNRRIKEQFHKMSRQLA